MANIFTEALPPTRSGHISRNRTSKACRRCQRQKLKCDTEKPCILCRRAGVECEVYRTTVWKTQLQSSYPHSKRQRRKRASAEEVDPSVVQSMPTSDVAEHPSESVPETSAPPQSRSGSPNSSYPDSSTLHLVKEAFDFHQSSDLATSVTSSLPRGRLPHGTSATNAVGTKPQTVRIGRLWNSRNRTGPEFNDDYTYSFPRIPPIVFQLRSRTVLGLLSVLPKDPQAMDLLIDTYFDRVHWFILVFHQDIFRKRARALLSRPDIQAADLDKDFSFACTVLIVAVMGLHYTCDYRRQRLAQLGVDPQTLLLELLSTTQAVLFDLVAVGSLESVQACVLLGSFYLFHGCPGPALPIISSGLRIAQGMGLHRRKTSRNSESFSDEHGKEEGNRCWLALFEIDRFCSMVYGLPISFANEDCDMELLVMSPRAIQPLQCPSTSVSFRNSALLFYKRHMAEFSTILTQILHELYRPAPKWNEGHTAPESSLGSQVPSLFMKIDHLDSKLRTWYKNVHPLLHLHDDSESTQRAYPSSEAMDQDIGGSGELFERHVLRMQAITMKFAFENAIIMTHRPLLSFRSARSLQNQNGQATSGIETPNPYKTSIETCRKAALNTAGIGSLSAFEEALDTYAASFVGIHIFTAGVVLCLIASFEPMTSQAHEAKAGIQKLITMQRKLRERSVIAAQGFEILQKAVSLVVERELQEMLGDVRSEGSMAPLGNQEPCSRQDIPDPVHVPGMSGIDNCGMQDRQSGLRVDPGEETDTQDSFTSQFPIGTDTGLLNIVNDEHFIMDDYQQHLGDFPADIEQGWIWDPTWFAHM